MALAEILARVTATMKQLAPTVDVAMGQAARARRGAKPPMVTWVPTADSFEFSGEHHNTGRTAKVLAVRLAGCDAHIWGAVLPQGFEDFRATEIIVEQVVNALRVNARGRDLFNVSGAWRDAGPSDATAYGRAYVLSFQFRIPIEETAVAHGQLVRPVPITQIAEMDFPSGQQIPNP